MRQPTARPELDYGAMKEIKIKYQ